jgi:hypothetical protein
LLILDSVALQFIRALQLNPPLVRIINNIHLWGRLKPRLMSMLCSFLMEAEPEARGVASGFAEWFHMLYGRAFTTIESQDCNFVGDFASVACGSNILRVLHHMDSLS